METITPVESRVNREPTLEELEARLVDARRAYARSEERRMGQVTSRTKEIDELTRLAYEEVRSSHGAKYLEDDLVMAGNDAERNLLTLTYLMNEQKALNAEIEDPTALTTMEKARRMGRSVIRAAGDWLTKGSDRVQFVKGVAVSTVAAAGFGILGGVAAAGGMATVRYLKGYASGMAKEVTTHTSTLEELQQKIGNDTFTDIHAVFDRAGKLMRAEREAAIEAHQERNLKAVKRGMGAMAVGAVVGTTVGSMIHYGFDFFGGTTAHAAETAGSVDVSSDHATTTTGKVDLESAHGATSETVDVSKGTVVAGDVEVVHGTTANGNVDVDGARETISAGKVDVASTAGSVDVSSDHATTTTGRVDVASAYGTTTTGTVDVAPAHEIDLSGEFDVEYKHGYTHEIIQAAKANGVDITPEEAWKWHQEIVDVAGRDYIDLHDFDGKDVYSMGDGKYEIGISSPSEQATWSPEAQEILKEKIAAKLHAGVDTVTGAASETEPITMAIPSVDAGEGINSFMADNYGYELSADQSVELGKALETTGDAYHSDYLGDLYGNPYGLSGAGTISSEGHAVMLDMANDGELNGNVGVSVGSVDVASDSETTGDVDVESGADVQSFTDADWRNIESMLEEAARRDQLNWISGSAQAQDFMKDLGPKLEGMTYGDGEPVVSRENGKWEFNDSTDMLPSRAMDVIRSYLEANDAAVEKLGRLAGIR